MVIINSRRSLRIFKLNQKYFIYIKGKVNRLEDVDLEGESLIEEGVGEIEYFLKLLLVKIDSGK